MVRTRFAFVFTRRDLLLEDAFDGFFKPSRPLLLINASSIVLIAKESRMFNCDGCEVTDSWVSAKSLFHSPLREPRPRSPPISVPSLASECSHSRVA